MHVYINADLNDGARAVIMAMEQQDTLHFAADSSDFSANAAALAKSQVAYGTLSWGEIERAGSLQWLQLESVGFEDLVCSAPQPDEPSIQITNLGHAGCDAVAETALAGILALTRGIRELTLLGERSEWRPETFRSGLSLLEQARVLLVGDGAIAGALRKRLVGFGCTDISGIRRRPGEGESSLQDLHSLLPRSDIVVASLPGTPQTRRLFDRLCFTAFKRGSLFVNLGRGSVVDEEALVASVNSGYLAGAVLDVTGEEPLPKESALWGARNVLLTQHTGGGSEDERVAKAEVFTGNLHRYRAGQPLLHRVDLIRGY